MRSLLGSLILVLVSSCLTGCWFGGDPSPTPTTSTPVFTPPSSTPTPKWTDEEQGAIDAVLKYLKVLADAGQKPQEADWGTIYNVADDSIAKSYIQLLEKWAENKWHLVGFPEFVPDWVSLSMINSQGNRYHVHGCLIIEDSFLVNEQNEIVPMEGRNERGTADITVLHTPEGSYIVVDDESEDKSC